MNKFKICMVGDFSVGKTSLTQKFVNNIFSEQYLTTIGVKIDTASMGDDKLIVWDVAGRDSLSPVNVNYLVGAAGIILVADGTRPETVADLVGIWQTVIGRIGEVPAVVALNKSDLDGWEVSQELQGKLTSNGWTLFNTSAKDGLNVTQVFEALLAKIKNQKPAQSTD